MVNDHLLIRTQQIVDYEPIQCHEHPRIVIGIGMYNEERIAALVLDDILSAIEHLDVECIIAVVDDGSTDKTFEILSAYKQIRLKKHSSRQGIGGVFFTLLEYSQLINATHFVFQEGSHKVPAKSIMKLINTSIGQDLDYTLGSRFLINNANNTPLLRKVLIKTLSRFFSIISGFSISDITCGPRVLKLTKWSATLNTILRNTGYSFEQIMTIFILHRRYSYKEVGIQVVYHELRQYSYVNIGNMWQIIAPWIRYLVWRRLRIIAKPKWII